MVYNAMTAAELRQCGHLPEKIAWMACHFSPYGTGLTNLPTSLPPDALLILNDRTPVRGHDPAKVADTLQEAVERLQCCGILLDFQRPDCAETAAITEKVLTLPCPVCVSHLYAKELDCPIFLPPMPLLKTAEEYLSPWGRREIWLEVALDGCAVSVTETESRTAPLMPGKTPDCPHYDVQLFCHYGAVFDQNKAVFTLKREKNDLQNLMKEAEKWGVTRFIGLWQELGQYLPPGGRWPEGPEEECGR